MAMATSPCPTAAFIPRQEDLARSGEHFLRGAVGCRHHQLAGGDTRKTALVRRFRGNPGSKRRVCGAAQRISQCLMRCSCRGGDGNITGSDVMWVNGRVQRAAATRRVVSALASRPPSKAGDRRERVSARAIRGSAAFGSVAERSVCCSAKGVATRPMHRESTPALDVLSIAACGVAGAEGALRGFLGASSEANRVAMRSPFGTFPRSEGTWSLLSGRVGGDRAVAATSRSGSSRTPHRPGIFRAADQRRWLFTLPLTSRRHRRATAGGVGVSNR
jgi:hypothetical protein